MASPNFDNLLTLYQQSLSVGVLEYLQKQAHWKVRRGVYSAQVVLWLMLLQRLHAVGTLAAAVQLLLQGAADPLLENCRRVKKKQISARTGGYCQARQKLPALLCRQVNREITAQLRQLVCPEQASGPRVYVLDGSSLELEPSRELSRRYPPASNQHGVSHWPVARVVVLHELRTGLAEELQCGPMFGEQAVSEQELAGEAMSRVPAAAVIVGDRNFGVLWVASEASQRGLGVVLRLTQARAQKLWGGPIWQEGERVVEWKASRSDGGKRHRVPAGTAVAGRMIAARVGRGKSKFWLYLFTTLDWPKEKIVERYGERWNIETDLRSLKRTVRLHHMLVKSPDMLEKELLMATAAYNLVRAVMGLASRKKGLDPRQLSFAMVLNVVDCAWHKLMAATTPEQLEAELARVLDLAAQCTLPKRSKPRSYPRMLWRRRPGFPYRTGEKTK
jgi:hypothetical protein